MSLIASDPLSWQQVVLSVFGIIGFCFYMWLMMRD